MESIDFVTDTATMCVFDLAALRHRLEDDADWWSIPAEEVAEVNRGNVIFIGLGDDGRYAVEFGAIAAEAAQLRCRLKVPKGRIFVGAGEEVSSEGLEPEAVRGGTFLELTPGVYELRAVRTGQRTVRLDLVETLGVEPLNSLTEPLRLERV
jgi:hypothetical protein